MTCKNCISYSACSARGGLFNEKDETKEMLCNHFKDKSKMFEIPCNMGDTVYTHFYFDDVLEIVCGKVVCIEIYSKYNVEIHIVWEEQLPRAYKIKDIGEKIFFTIEEAKAKLKERDDE